MAIVDLRPPRWYHAAWLMERRYEAHGFVDAHAARKRIARLVDTSS
jgi:hypothetical protein